MTANKWENFKSFAARRPVGLAVAALILLALIFGGYSSCRSRLYDRSDARHEAEKARLRQERDAAVERANAAEAKALLLEAKDAKTDELIRAKGGEIQKAEAQLEKRIEEAKRGAGDCSALPDSSARLDCTRAKLRALGL